MLTGERLDHEGDWNRWPGLDNPQDRRRKVHIGPFMSNIKESGFRFMLRIATKETHAQFINGLQKNYGCSDPPTQ